MWTELLMRLHPVFGVFSMLITICVFVMVFFNKKVSFEILRLFAWLQAIFMWLAYFVGGFWYVKHYSTDKNFILKGPFPSGHKFFMESKEHLFLNLLLLSTILPLVFFKKNVLENKDLRKFTLTISGMIIIFTLVIEWFGSFIGMAVKLGLLSQLGVK